MAVETNQKVSSASHTPGPWIYDDDGMIYAEVESLGKFFSVKVCDPHADKLDIDEREANARLIAAAPELLAALRVAREYMDAHEDASGYESDKRTRDLAAIDAAISRAEGTTA